ncbi:MAG: tetratricopeptide repeat protein [bacterium]|nr:tetratricopeptide repeat protein [bacterium]
MKKIKVQTRLNFIVYLLIFLFLMGLVFAVVHFVLLNSAEPISARTKSDSWELIFLVLFIIPFLFREVMARGEYVSEMIFNNGILKLIYKEKGKVIRTKSIEMSSIEVFNVSSFVEAHTTSRSRFFTFSYSIIIKPHNEDEIYIDVQPSIFITNKKLLFDLISISQFIPNFSYNLHTDENAIIEEIEYFKKYGKKIPLYKRKNGIVEIILNCILALASIAILASLVMLGTTFTKDYRSDSYVGLFALVDENRNNRNYDAALYYVNEAKKIEPKDYNVYLYEAYVYEKKKDYKKEIECANMAKTLLDNKEKSRYDKFFHNDSFVAKYIFKEKNSGYVRTYSRLADANYKLKNYNAAVDYYSYIIENGVYKYTDAYFYRGICLYHLGKKQEALQDFKKHQEIINNYLIEMQDMKYPQYTNKDLENVLMWIKACLR